jgi:hypothetical protein
VPPSTSRRQDLGFSDSYRPTPVFASSPDQAASTRSNLPNKQLHYIKRWFDDLVPPPPHLDRELLQSPATTFKSSFGRPVCTSNTPSSTDAQHRPMPSTVFHLAVRTLVPLRLFDGELVTRRRCVAVFFWSKDLCVIRSSSEDFCVKLAA